MKKYLILALILAACGHPIPCPPLCPPPPTPAPTPPAATPTATAPAPTPTPRPAASPPPLQGRLVSVRGWDRYSGPGQRPRLGADSGGGLRIAWTTKPAGGRMQATLEDGSGRVLEQHLVQVSGPAEYFPALPVGGRLLYRSGAELRWGDDLAGAGEWEAYAGYASGDRVGIVAWQPCAAGAGCPASAIWRDGGVWRASPWARELFGVALAPAGAGRVAMASRENPANSGLTLRTLDEQALLRGEIVELGAAQSWRPPRGLSLEDPTLVLGASRPVALAEAFDLQTKRSSGRVFLAELGAQLREVLQAWPSDGNVEVAGAELGGVLYLADELAEGRSALWRWQGSGLVLLGNVPGEAPSLGLAEGSLWMSSTRGLWRLE